MTAPGRLAAALALALAGGCAVPYTAEPPRPAQAMVGARHVIVTIAPGDAAGRAVIMSGLAQRHAMQAVGAWPLEAINRDCVVLEAAAPVDAAALARLRADPAVVNAQLMGAFVTTAAAQGRAAATEGEIAARQPNLAAIGAFAAHRAVTGAGVTVAVIDTAIAVDHPDLGAGRVSTRDFVEDGVAGPERHGTAVGGVLAAHGRLRGVAPAASVLGLRACWEGVAGGGGACSTVSLARALNFAALSGAAVVNLSLAGPPDALLAELIDAVIARGAVVVAARDGDGDFPASHPGVVAAAGRGASAVLAPATDVASLSPDGGHDFYSGASMAAAQVAGVAALMAQARPELDGAARAAALSTFAGRLVDASALIGSGATAALNQQGARRH